jgi:hypothetical protein
MARRGLVAETQTLDKDSIYYFYKDDRVDRRRPWTSRSTGPLWSDTRGHAASCLAKVLPHRACSALGLRKIILYERLKREREARHGAGVQRCWCRPPCPSSVAPLLCVVEDRRGAHLASDLWGATFVAAATPVAPDAGRGLPWPCLPCPRLACPLPSQGVRRAAELWVRHNRLTHKVSEPSLAAGTGFAFA